MLDTLKRRIALACVATGIAGATGCHDTGSTGSPGEHVDAGTAADGARDAGGTRPKLAVIANWRHYTLSLLDFDALTDQADAGAAARIGEIDLSQYSQPPYAVKLTPDGRTAVVTLSTGFFVVPGAAALLLHDSALPTGPSKVLLIDMASKTIRTELDTGDGPAGIAITHDGRRAFVSHASTSMLSVLDLEAGTLLQQVDVGGGFAEDVALDETDTVGIVTALGSGSASKSARTFAVANPAGTLSAPIPLDNDAAGVPFFPGTKTALVVLAYNPLTSPKSGYALIDASDPHAPVKVIETQWSDGVHVTFEAFAAPTRGTVLMPVATGGNLEMREYGLDAGDVVLKNTFPVTTLTGFGPFGSVLDSRGRMVMTLPGDRELGVLDLGTGNAFTVPWFKEPGPMGIDLH